MKKLGTTGFTTIVLLIVLVGAMLYTYVNNKSATHKEVKVKSDKEQMLEYDFSQDYPKTPREVVKMHCEYLKQAYNGGFTEDELYTVNKNIRELFDDELLDINAEDEQLEKMREEIQYYQDNKQKFTSYTLPEGSQVEYNTDGDTEYAKLKVKISLQVDTSPQNGSEEYILRKDKDGRWKILGWQAVKIDQTQDKGDTES